MKEKLIRVYRKITGILPFKFVIYMDYLIKQKKILNLKNPKSFSEKIQWIKIYGKLEKYSYLVDKYEVRSYVTTKIGKEYLNNLYGIYEDVNQIDFEKLPNKFVLKLNNGSGYNLICKDKSSIDIVKVKNDLEKWIKVDFYKEHKEIQYKNVKSKILCEEYLEDETGDLKDYKIFCFNGKAEIIQVDTNRFSNHIQNMYDTNWNKLNLSFGYNSGNIIDKKPAKLNEILILAEKLSEDMPFARIDFYYVDNKIYFGEITLTPQNGLVSFSPESEDDRIANMINLEKYK
ncbi:ATP-grasp fold amidoligase family protein [Romboutsia timonensis]|uniref:ATP-grasp fold amidoligase family protein n=1 Tax=Romboutsia timonensis TaxID=1776391 RepID=UPI002A83B46A|nr:ATP-grasp fold amidoligase family protein [Romboutsia timonensis]MDY3959626.1 ATP-grasp fold amidoligase family protein [Romboutsia timonensis]